MKADFRRYHLSDGGKIITPEIPGKESLRLLKMQKDMEGSIVSYPVNMPVAFKRAKGAIIEDADGNLLIDFFSCAGVVNLGHCNEDVLKYIEEQQEDLIHALDFPTQNKLDLIRRIRQCFPEQVSDEYKVSFCGPTGSDAVEAAIKLAKHSTGRNGVIAFHGSYHGMTAGSLAATSNTGFRRTIDSLMPDVHFIPYSYCYRCPFSQDNRTCKLECAEYLRYILDNPHSGINKPAAILIEPIQGEGGNIVPREGYLEKIVGIAREHGIIVIFDEIQCGFFRTGRFMASQHTDAMADIYTFSKGLGGVGLPISAIAYRKEIESWGPGFHVGTFRGNQLSIAAGNGAFEFVDRWGVDQHAAEMGDYLLSRLGEIGKSSQFVGEVRGKGLMIGIEYVKDKRTRQPFPELARTIQQACFKRGLLFETGGHFSNVVRLLPPLIITKEIVDNALDIYEEASREAERTFVSKPEMSC